MGSLIIRADCRVSGPLADGSADKALQDWAANTTQALADKGVELLKSFPMDKTGRGRGGFEGALTTKRISPTEVRIPGPTQRGVTWAPWLEGSSSRNESTKFAGYGLFRKTRLQLQKMAPDVAQQELEKVMPQIGGA